MPHEQECTWECASGYMVDGTLSCDRGIFVGGAACVKRPCADLPAKDNKKFSKSQNIKFSDLVDVSCEIGYKLTGKTSSISCTEIGEDPIKLEYSVDPDTIKCEKRSCSAVGPLANTAGGCSSALEFGETCTINCNNGFANKDATKFAQAKCTCPESEGDCSFTCGDGGCDAQCTVAVTCSGDDATALDANTIDQGGHETLPCVSNSVATDGSCTRTCKGGYTNGGKRDGAVLTFTCSDDAGTGSFAASGSCEERECDASSLQGMSAGTASIAAGAVTEVQCSASGEEIVGASFVKCVEGSYVGCADSSCASSDTIPTCVKKGAKSKVVPVVQFEMEFAMDTSWVNKDTCGKAKGSIADTFCGADYMDCAKNGIELRVTGLKVGGEDPCTARRLGSLWQRHLQGSGALTVEFEAKAKAGASADVASAALQKAKEVVQGIETMDTSALTQLADVLSDDLTKAVGVPIAVQGVVVTQSAKEVSIVEVAPEEKKKEEAGGGLGGGAIAGIVIGVLVVVGGGFFFMKGKGGGGDRA